MYYNKYKDPYSVYRTLECKKDIQKKNIDKLSVGASMDLWGLCSVALRVYHFNNELSLAAKV